MATLWIREYSSVASIRSNGRGVSGAPMVQEPGIDQTPVSFTGATQSSAFNISTTYIAIISDAAFHYVIGTNPTATTNALKVPANTPLYIGGSGNSKISVIAAA